MDEVLDEVQNFARQQPALFLGTAVLLGLVAARFLKSSTPDGMAGGHGTGVQRPAPGARDDTYDSSSAGRRAADTAEGRMGTSDAT